MFVVEIDLILNIPSYLEDFISQWILTDLNINFHYKCGVRKIDDRILYYPKRILVLKPGLDIRRIHNDR